MQQTQKITAYKVQFYPFRKSDLLQIGKEEGMFDFTTALNGFLTLAVSTIKVDTISRAIRIKEKHPTKLIQNYTRYNGWFYAGQYGKKGLIENLEDESIKELKISDVHFMQHFVFFYIDESKPTNECYFIFHRYSTGGAKTIFFEAFRRYLIEKYQINVKESAITDTEMIIKENCSVPEMKLIRHTSRVIRSSDQSENVSTTKTKNTDKEYEVLLFLKNPLQQKMAKGLFGIKNSEDKISKIRDIIELKNVKQNDEDNEFLDYEIRVELFGKKRWVNIDEIEKLYFEYDVTALLEYEDDYPKYNSLEKIVDDYFKIISGDQ